MKILHIRFCSLQLQRGLAAGRLARSSVQCLLCCQYGLVFCTLFVRSSNI